MTTVKTIPCEYYQLAEEKTSKVSPAWRVLHVLFYIGIAVFSYAAAAFYSHAFQGFRFNCILYADMHFKNGTANRTGHQALMSQGLPVIDIASTSWGSTLVCNTSEYVLVFSMISATVWGCFFLILSRGGAGRSNDLLEKPWRIVLPAIIYSIVIMIPIVVAYVFADQGFSKFCNQFQPALGVNACSSKLNIFTTQYVNEEVNVYDYMQIALKFTQCALYLWLAQLIVLIIRILLHPDFTVYKISVFDLGNPVQPETEAL